MLWATSASFCIPHLADLSFTLPTLLPLIVLDSKKGDYALF